MIRLNLYTGLGMQQDGLNKVRRALVIAACIVSGAVLVGLTVLLVKTLSSIKSSPPAAQEMPGPGTALSQAVRAPYRSLSLTQRIAYEVLFVPRIAESLSGALSPRLGLTLFAVDSFEIVRVEGKTTAREEIAALLGRMRTGDFSLEPKPLTKISPTENGLFEYVAVARACFPQEQGIRAPDTILASLPPTSLYQEHVRRFEQLAAAAGVSIRKGLRFVSAQKAGPYRRYMYRMEGVSSCEAFLSLAREVSAKKLSCAFGSVVLRAEAAAPKTMNVNAELYFMARDSQ